MRVNYSGDRDVSPVDNIQSNNTSMHSDYSSTSDSDSDSSSSGTSSQDCATSPTDHSQSQAKGPTPGVRERSGSRPPSRAAKSSCTGTSKQVAEEETTDECLKELTALAKAQVFILFQNLPVINSF